ncbi:hypothetical protein [Rubripirellula lacrimiformis]|uniref:hypothetical protein n=1 Tax=Rubripirellula lacrimiformis TaxID=1930273 RepID=UPI0011A7DF08|nr:hypothetical protein [Rubripirellula lacrimiformis]
MAAEMSTVAVKIETNHGLNYTVVVPKFPVRSNSPAVPASAATGSAKSSDHSETMNRHSQDGRTANVSS